MQLTHNGHVSLFNHIGFGVFDLVGWQSFHSYVNVMWRTKGIGSPFFQFCFQFYSQTILMTTPQTQVISIWKRVVDVSEGLFFIKARQFFQVFLSSPLLIWYASGTEKDSSSWFVLIPLTVYLLRWIFGLLGLGSFHLVPLSLPLCRVLCFIDDW